MTTTETENPVCPSCRQQDSISLENGFRFCLGCRTEWDPTAVDVAALPLAPVQPMEQTDREDVASILRAPSAADVLGPPSDIPEEVLNQRAIDEVARILNLDWSEKWVRTNGGDVLLITEDNLDDMVYGVDASGQQYHLSKHGLTFLGDEPIGPGETAGLPNDISDEPLMPIILAVAGLALTVALEAAPLEPGGPWGNARIGWAPPPGNEIPELEQGIVYAIVSLMDVFELDREKVEKLAANFLVGAEGGTETAGQ